MTWLPGGHRAGGERSQKSGGAEANHAGERTGCAGAQLAAAAVYLHGLEPAHIILQLLEAAVLRVGHLWAGG